MEIFEFIFGAITAFGIVFGVITYFVDAKRKKKKDTLDAYCELQKNTLSSINLFLPSEIKQLLEDKQSDNYKIVSGYLADIERFCLGVNQGIYDFKTFYKLAHGYFDSDRGMLKPRLLPIMEVKLDNAKEDYFENIHKVWNRMEKKNS